jgi:hypothetical protein
MHSTVGIKFEKKKILLKNIKLTLKFLIDWLEKIDPSFLFGA